MKISLNMNNTPDFSNEGQRGGFALPSIVKFPPMDDEEDAKNCESIRTTKNEEL